MEHACTATGLNLQEASNSDQAKVGDYVHLASRDTFASAGVVKVFAASKDGIRKIYAALHGQAIQVGQDNIGVEVRNDLMTLDAGQGNDPRLRP